MDRMASLCTPGGGARDITLGDPLRRTSDGADLQDLLGTKAVELTYPAGRLLGIRTK
ncbi:hypothetical protein [Streptomyces sp. A244]|uniref:hypothetical protein n=1 Tax=Streptomyces sp. A244 TaxID=2137016 RepID=UPI0015E71B69|nr:hypothetical protein [Streptomyces sp. A244]